MVLIDNLNTAFPRKTNDAASLQEMWRQKVLNLKLSWLEFQTGQLQPSSLPSRVVVELTQNCNFKCPMCPQSMYDKFKNYNPDFNMPMELFLDLADQIFPTANFVDLRGFGESTLHPQWDKILDLLENYPFVNWHLITNLSNPKIGVWDKMMKLGFELGFSCDGATPETFESIRFGGRFSIIRQNLAVIRDANQKYKKGLIYFLSTIQKKNVHEMRALVELAHEFSVPEVQFKTVQGHLQPELYEMPPELIQKYTDQALDAALLLNVRVTYNDWFFTKGLRPEKLRSAESKPIQRPSNFAKTPDFAPHFWAQHSMGEISDAVLDSHRVSQHQKCFKPFSFTYISYKGEVGTCNHMMDPSIMVMGDLTKQSIKEIWNGEKYVDFRQQLLQALPKDSRCQWCFKHRMED